MLSSQIKLYCYGVVYKSFAGASGVGDLLDAGVITTEKGIGESGPITKQTLTRFQAQEPKKHVKNYFSIKNYQAST